MVKDMIAPEPTAAGLSLGSMCWATYNPQVRSDVDSTTTSTIAPAVLVPGRNGEPYRLDTWYPPHPRGTGEIWPNESQVSKQIGAGRFPLVAAWTGRLLTGQKTWRWRSPAGVEVECTPIEAIAESIGELVAHTCQASPTAVVVPNSFRQIEQQKVIDACSARSLDVSLIWLPIAAALEWLSQNAESLPGPHSSLSSYPKLLVCHCDWGHTTLTTLDLVPWPTSSPTCWVPARNRPDPSDTSTGFGWMSSTSLNGHSEADLMNQWSEFFGKPYRIPSQLVENVRYEGFSILEAVQNWDIPQSPVHKIQQALEKKITQISGELAGVIVLGDWAKHLNVEEFRNSTLHPASVIQLSECEAESFLARGAARFRSAQLQGETCYLDTLPELDLFIEQQGELIWHPLLQGDSKYVAGGTPWKSENPIDVSVRRGEERVRLVVWHEEYDGVREIVAELKQPAEQRLPGKLYVSATPAQGNAVLRIDLEGEYEQSQQGIIANWKRMQQIRDGAGNPVDKQRFLEIQPRAYPELMPRQGSDPHWQIVQSKIRLIAKGSEVRLGHIAAAQPYALDTIKELLLRKDPALPGQDSTAVGSDHAVNDRHDLLVAFTAACLEYWDQHKDGPLRNKKLETVVRILGYISAADDRLEKWLVECLSSLPMSRQVIVHACGHCLRTPPALNTFFLAVFELLPGSSLTTNADSLKAVSQALRYRVDATQQLSDTHASRIIEVCLDIFQNDMENAGGSTFNFRWTALIVGFLLRRRIYNSDFLPPDGQLATRAKELFEEAIRRYKRGRLSPIGGSVDTPGAIQQLIDYIDKKGVGPLLLGIE